ncbi:MAG: hypothetical protein V7637_6461 [Mycobacteriales bacterium]|jgi:hypothetical protein
MAPTTGMRARPTTGADGSRPPALAAAAPDPVSDRLGIPGTALARRIGLNLPPDLPVDKWRSIGEQIYLITDSSAWWLGDWLIYGQDRYADRYRRLVEESSLDYQTLRNYAWVARRFPVSRRRNGLSFQHHAEVAALGEAEQDRLLGLAHHHGWSRNQLRARVRAARTRPDEQSAGPAAILLTVPAERQRSWEDAARHAGLDLLAWIAGALDDAARTRLAGDGGPDPG